MGLTIHYSISVPTNWTPATIREKLEAARQFAKTLPVKSVSELVEFKGKECDFRPPVGGREGKDPFGWAKCQATRSIDNPWMPGTSTSQSPNHMLVFSVDVGTGCEQMNVGVCRFPKHVWKPSKELDVPAWSLAFKDQKYYPDSVKLIRSFMRKWNVTKLADSRKGVSKNDRFGWVATLGYHSDRGFATAEIRKGRYLSHRRGYAGNFGLVCLRDRMGQYEIYFKHRGTAEEAAKTFDDPEFRADLTALVTGKTHITPPARGTWSSFCKTQFAYNHGWPNFAKAHLSVLLLLEHVQSLGFAIEVSDEGGMWETKDITVLAKRIGESSEGLAALAGALKDIAGAEGMTVESPITEHPQYEHLEAKGQGTLTDLLKLIATRP
jgi:hypothetical protein